MIEVPLLDGLRDDRQDDALRLAAIELVRPGALTAHPLRGERRLRERDEEDGSLA